MTICSPECKTYLDNEIKMIREDNKNDRKLDTDIGALSYYILKRIYGVDDDDIPEQIVEPAHQWGINAYDYDENNRILNLIFVKIINEGSNISQKSYTEYFLNDGITILQQGNFRDKKLQDIFKALTSKKKYTIRLSMYVTTNKYSKGAEEAISAFNKQNGNYEANICYLNNIIDMANVPEYEVKMNWNGDLIINDGSKPVACKMKKYGIDAEVTKIKTTISLYDLFQFAYSAITSGYPLFKGNLRRFVGLNDVNKSIYNTILNDDDRATFNIRNNGITIICDAIKYLNGKIVLVNPRIVNGCQTTSTVIATVTNKDIVPEKLKDGSVDVSIITACNISDDMRAVLYTDIVRGTNSQTAIPASDFYAVDKKYLKLKEELKEFGICLFTRQSDKVEFYADTRNKTPREKLITKAKKCFEKCGLKVEDHFNNATNTRQNLGIDVRDYMQIVLAFVRSGDLSFANKYTILNLPDKAISADMDDFLENATPESKAMIFFLYRYACVFEDRKKSDPERTMIPWYAVDMISHYICDGQYDEIPKKFVSLIETNILMSRIKVATKQYMDSYADGMRSGKYLTEKRKQSLAKQDKPITEAFDYSKMIKRPIDREMLSSKWETSYAKAEYIEAKYKKL